MAARIKHHWVTLRSKLAPWGWQQLQDQPFHWRRNHFSTLAARVGPVQERSCRCSTLASQIKWARIWNKHVAKTMVVNFRFQCCWIKLGSKRSICRAKLVNPLCKLQHVNLDKVAKWTNVDEIWTVSTSHASVAYFEERYSSGPPCNKTLLVYLEADLYQ